MLQTTRDDEDEENDKGGQQGRMLRGKITYPPTQFVGKWFYLLTENKETTIKKRMAATTR